MCVRKYARGEEDHPGARRQLPGSVVIDPVTCNPVADGDEIPAALAGKIKAEAERKRLIAQISELRGLSTTEHTMLYQGAGVPSVPISKMNNQQLKAWLELMTGALVPA